MNLDFDVSLRSGLFLSCAPIKTTMKNLIRLEDAAKLVAAVYFSAEIGFGPLTFLLFILVPDVSMIGYLINTKVGAYLYNIAHHQGIALVVLLIGYLTNQPETTFAGLILFGHSAMDRMFGYGLKYTDDFKHTHLGWIGKR